MNLSAAAEAGSLSKPLPPNLMPYASKLQVLKRKPRQKQTGLICWNTRSRRKVNTTVIDSCSALRMLNTADGDAYTLNCQACCYLVIEHLHAHCCTVCTAHCSTGCIAPWRCQVLYRHVCSMRRRWVSWMQTASRRLGARIEDEP